MSRLGFLACAAPSPSEKAVDPRRILLITFGVRLFICGLVPGVHTLDHAASDPHNPEYAHRRDARPRSRRKENTASAALGAASSPP